MDIFHVITGSYNDMRKRRQIHNYFYTVMCENSIIDLRCPPSLVIVIDHANFGRTDNITCAFGQSSVISECYSQNAREIFSDR